MVMGALCLYVQRIQMLDKKNKAKYQNPELKKFRVFLLSLLITGCSGVRLPGLVWDQDNSQVRILPSRHEKRKTPILEHYDFVFRNIFRIFISCVGGLVFVVICKSLLSSAVEHFAVNEVVQGSNP